MDACDANYLSNLPGLMMAASRTSGRLVAHTTTTLLVVVMVLEGFEAATWVWKGKWMQIKKGLNHTVQTFS